jgi:tetratricopeptide (TPR) repeat protein
MSFEAIHASLAVRSGDPGALGELARAALAEGHEERALPLLRRAATQRVNASLWQWTGLLERSLEEHEQALASFSEAARLAPADAGIAHGRARVALEAGFDSVALFEVARRLAPANGDVLLGVSAARFAAGRGEEAEAELDSILVQVPLWVQGHAQLAQLRSMLGKADQATASLERALATTSHPALWRELFQLHLRREDYAGLERALDRGRSVGVNDDDLSGYDAIAAAELAQFDRADTLFAIAESAGGPPLAIWRIRHLLRSGRAGDALPLIDHELASQRAAEAWPYAAAAWRLTGDDRWQWLEGDERLVSVLDLTPDLPPIDRLADVLRSLHVARGEYLDQSVRGGTQTDGPLFARIEPEIRALRAAVVGAVERHIAQLPPPDSRHPLLSRPRNRRVRFSGSWSVRLRGAGFHSNHVHPEGWVSSALYVALPDADPQDVPHAGWLTLGEPQAQLRLALPPIRRIPPKLGQLVLFPCWMWHGTVPFAQGERLTVAFDVAPPR